MTQNKKFINQVKKAVKNQPIPPIYNPSEWEEKDFNCYAYAMRVFMNLDFYGPFIGPGFISNGILNNYKSTKKCTLKYFKKDCEALGLKVLPTYLEEEINANEYKIAVYVNPGYDFHFARQDANGIWSEKDCWGGPIKTIEPEDVTKTEDGYEFIGMFKVSKKE